MRVGRGFDYCIQSAHALSYSLGTRSKALQSATAASFKEEITCGASGKLELYSANAALGKHYSLLIFGQNKSERGEKVENERKKQKRSNWGED